LRVKEPCFWFHVASALTAMQTIALAWKRPHGKRSWSLGTRGNFISPPLVGGD
jgi:hypothetical protein